MIVLVLLILGVLGFFWMLKRSWNAGYGKFLGWLLWFLFGIAATLSSPNEPSLPTKVMVNLWAFSVVLLPLWWLFRWMFPPRLKPQHSDDYSDLKPILDEHGKQRWP